MIYYDKWLRQLNLSILIKHAKLTIVRIKAKSNKMLHIINIHLFPSNNNCSGNNKRSANQYLCTYRLF